MAIKLSANLSTKFDHLKLGAVNGILEGHLERARDNEVADEDLMDKLADWGRRGSLYDSEMSSRSTSDASHSQQGVSLLDVTVARVGSGDTPMGSPSTGDTSKSSRRRGRRVKKPRSNSTFAHVGRYDALIDIEAEEPESNGPASVTAGQLASPPDTKDVQPEKTEDMSFMPDFDTEFWKVKAMLISTS